MDIKEKILRIRNYIVLVLSLFLILSLFTTIATHDFTFFYNIDPVTIRADYVEFIETSAKGFDKYSISDFLEDESVALSSLEDIKNIRYLKYFMIDETDGGAIIQRIMIYTTTTLLICLLIIPLIIFVKTIISIVKNKQTNYRTFFIVLLVLSSLLFFTIPLFGYRVGLGIYLYQGILFCGFFYSYLTELFSGRKFFEKSAFIYRLVSISLLFLIIYFSSTDIIEYVSINGDNRYNENINFGHIPTIINLFCRYNKDFLIANFTIYTFMYASPYLDFIPYLLMFIYLCILTSLVLVIITIIIDTIRYTSLAFINFKTSRLILFAFLIQVNTIVMTLVLVGLYNINPYHNIRLSLSYLIYSIFVVITSVFYLLKTRKFMEEM